MKQKILVVVCGGNVQSVLASDPNTVEVVIFDQDNLGQGEGLTSVEVERAYEENSKALVEVEFRGITSLEDGSPKEAP